MTQIQPAPMSSQMPGEVAQLAQAGQLGAPVAVFPPGKRWRLVGWLGVLALLFSVATVGVGATTSGQEGSDPLVTWLVVGGICLVLIALALWPAVTGPLLSMKARERKFYVFQHGFVHVGRSATQGYRFDAVSELRALINKVYYNGISTGTNYKFTVHFADGRVLKLNTFSTDMAEFGPLLQRAVANSQVPRFAQHLQSGGTLRFGKILMTATGLATDRKPLLPWSEVSGVNLHQGFLFVNQQGKRLAWAKAKGAETPNLYAFLALADHFLSAAR